MKMMPAGDCRSEGGDDESDKSSGGPDEGGFRIDGIAIAFEPDGLLLDHARTRDPTEHPT